VEQVLSYANVLSAEAANELYTVCQIGHLLKRRTDELSGGERQRIALTRLLITSPKLLLLDEPFSNLDRVHEHILESVIRKIGKKLGITVILVSHEPLEILSWAHKILIMKDGQIIQKGPPQKIYRQPVNEYAAGLFGKYNLLTREQANLFFPLNAETLKKKNIVVRPENFNILPKGKKGMAGKVMKVHFFGSYSEIEIMVKDFLITVKTSIPVLRGDKVSVSLNRDGAWFI
jgi:iron(III) transport system ATP-binding protein